MLRVLGVLTALLGASLAWSQTPVVDENLPAENFLGEQFCFQTNFTNTGSPGYGPYLRVELSSDLTLDSADVFGTGTGFTNVGTFPASPGNQLTDPVTGQTVSGTPGNAFLVVTYPVGSVVDGGPDLPVDLCLTIDPGATVGASLPVNITPMYEFGDTPTGDNGPITGSTFLQGVVPTVLTFSKRDDAPESERPPATTWPYTYTLTADIANTATINPLVIGDQLPADFQYTGPVNITGGVGCSVTTAPSTLMPGGSLEVTCSGNTVGTTTASDVVVSYSGYIIDTLDETVCTTEDQVNNASADGTYVPASGPSQILPPINDTTTVTAKHVAVQKGVSPGLASPGAALNYTLNFQVTDFGDPDSLIVTDILPDGIDFVAHDTLSVNGSPVAITPSVTVNGDFTTTIVYDIGAVAGTIPASSAITLEYDAQLRQDYQDTGEPILSSDSLTNTVTADYSLTQGASGCSDGSGATVDIIPVALNKQIVNVQPFYVPGESIIFRLRLDVPAGDTSEILFEDFFPLPVIDVNDISTMFGTDITYGPNDTLGLTPDSITINSAQNALVIEWPDVTSTTPETIEVDVSAPINDIPFADGLFLTNILLAATENTPGQSAIATGPVNFQVGAPDMVVMKGVSATNGNGSINPSPGDLPVDGDISGIDAGDTITYTITAENQGSAQAFDVTITDPAAPELTGCSISSVTDGAGMVLAFTGSLATGIILDDPLAANDGSLGAPYGTDTALVTVDCQVVADLAPDSTIINTASLNWTSQGGAATFPTLTDDAMAESTDIGQQKYFIASSEPGTSDGANPPRATIGEIVRYRAAVRIPEGEISQLSLRDNLPSGLTFLDDGTATAAFVSNGAGLSSSTLAVPTISGNASSPGALPSGSITFAVPGGAISGGPFSNGTDPVFAFGDVTNADSDADDEFLLLEFNALVNNDGAGGNGVGDNRNNNFTTLSNGSPLNGDSNNVQVRVAEPAVSVAKSAIPATGDAGDTISFNVSVTAASGGNRSPAHEVAITDILPSGLAGLSGLTITPSGCTAPGIVDNTVGDTLDVSVAIMTPGCQIDIAFDATLQNTVAPGTSITNTASAIWTSLPGTNGTASNPTGSTTPGTPGSDSGERDGSGGINDYADSGSGTVSVESVAVTKAVIATSEAETGSSEFRPGVPDLVIGESATFEINVTIPEGSTPQVVITDTVPFSNGVMRVDSASVVSVGANLSPVVPSPVPAISDTQMADGINDTVSFDFGQVDNTPDNAVTFNDQIIVRVVATLVDETANVNDDDLTNGVLVQFGPGLDASASADIDVVEPILSVDKSGSITQGDAGDSVTYTVTLQHTGGSAADAQDLVFDDPLPADLTLSLPSIQVVSGPNFDANTSAGNTVSLGWTDLQIGEVVVLEYQATLAPGVQPSEMLNNTATVTWDSIAGADPDQRTNNDSDSHSILVTQPGLAKVVFDTSETSTGSGEFGAPDDLTIGELVTYRFTTVFAEGTSDAVVVTDQLPTGSSTLEVVSSQVISVGANLSGASLPLPGDAGVPSDTNLDTYNDRLEWSFGTIQNAPDGALDASDEITFEVVAQVIDVAANQSGDTDQLNTATLTTSTSTASGTVGVDIVAPDVDLAKSIVDPADGFVDAGDTITVRLDIDHRAASTADAFNLSIADTLPAGLTWGGDGTVGGTCPGLVTDSSAQPVIAFDIATLDLASDNCFITYEVTVDNTVMPGESLQNSAEMDYDSQPVFAAGETRRRTSADTAEVTVLAPTLVKVDIDSSLNDTGMAEGDPTLRDLTIGETVTYELTAVLPEGVTVNAVLVDSLPDVMEAIGAVVTATGGNLSTTLPGTPVFDDLQNGDGIDDTVTFDFGDVTNTPDGVDDANDRITVEIVARIVDVPANTGGDVLVNNAQFTYDGGSLSDDAEIEIVEPQTDLTKSMGPVTDGTVRISLTIDNTGTAPAYDLSVEDVFDEADWNLGGFSPVSVPSGFNLSLQPGVPGPGQQTLVFATDPGAVSPAGTVPAGSSVSAVFDVPLAVLPPSPNPLPNTANQVAGDTLPGEDPAERDLPVDSDTDQIGLPDLVLTKTAALETDADSSGDVSPGDTLRYTLTLDNNGAVAANGIVIDDSPDANSALVVGSVVTSLGTVNIGNTLGDATVQVAVPSLAASDTAIVEYDTVIDSPLTAGVTEVVNQAAFDSDELPPGVSDDPGPPDPDDPTVVPVNAAPDLSVVKTDSVGSAAPGDTIVYSLDYANNGNQDATGVDITETVPAATTFNAGASTAGWSCGGTAPGSTCTFSVGNLDAGNTGSVLFAVDVDAPLDSGVTQVLNSTSIADDGSNGPDPTPGDNSDDETTPIEAAPDLVLSKDDGGASTAPGGSVAWTLDYENVGNQQATGVTITDTVPVGSSFDAGGSTAGWACVPDNSAGSNCTFNVGTVAGNGGSGSVVFAVTVDNPLAADVTELVNGASVADDGSNGADPTPGNNSDVDDTPINGAVPDLVLSKDDGGATTTPGGAVTWTIGVENVGNQNATGVVITDTVPANSSFNPAASSPGWGCVPDGSAGSVCSLAIGGLTGSGGSTTASFSVTVDNPLAAGVTELVNGATVADDGSNGADPTPGNNSDGDNTPINGAAPDLVLSKDDGGATTIPGGTVAWTLSFQNVGNQDATGVILTDIVPANATFEPGASSPGWSCIPDASSGSACSLAVGSLAAAASGNATFAVTVDDPLASGVTELFNGATVADDGNNGADPTPDNNNDSDTTPIDAQFDLSIVKADGGVTTTPGDTVVYTLDYLNSGDQNTTGVEITETVPANTVFDAGASTAGWVCMPDGTAGSNCVFTLGTVAGGDSGAVDFAVTVDDPLPGGVDEIVNTAGIGDDGSNGPDPTPDDNSDGDTTPVGAVPDLRIIKTDGGVTAAPGDTVVWTLDYENVGDQDATGVEITETVPANSSFDAGASTAGWNCVPDASAGSACMLTIGDLDVGDSGQALFAVVVADPIPDTVTELPNTATIGDDGSNGQDANPNDNESSVVTPVEVSPELSIDKALSDAPDPIELGSVLTYTVTATNTGNVTLENVIVSDAMVTPTGGTTPCGSVAPGETCTLIGTYTVTQSDVDAGEVVNTGAADSDDTNEVDTEVTTPIGQNPSIELIKEAQLRDGTPPGDIGDWIDYTLTVTNTGDVTLDNVEVVDNLIVLDCTPAQPSTLAPAEVMICTGSYEIQVSDLGSSQITNVAIATGDAPDDSEVEDEDSTATPIVAPIHVPIAGWQAWLILMLAIAVIGMRQVAVTLR